MLSLFRLCQKDTISFDIVAENVAKTTTMSKQNVSKRRRCVVELS